MDLAGNELLSVCRVPKNIVRYSLKISSITMHDYRLILTRGVSGNQPLNLPKKRLLFLF